MKKVLVTGMSAPQASSRLAGRNATFAGVVSKLLAERGVVVEHREPWIVADHKELKKYASVVVGVSPILSLSANHAYGALSIIDALRSDARLRLMIDAPDPEKIAANFRALERRPDDMVKPLYSARRCYEAAAGDSALKSRLFDAAMALHSDWNIKTLIPAAVGVEGDDIARRVGADVAHIASLNVDAALIKSTPARLLKTRTQAWCVDAHKSKWFSTVQRALMWSWTPVKAHKGETDDAVERRLSEHAGALISPSDGGLLWWTPRMAQAINVGTVVVTEWRSAAVLGESWTRLPGAVEAMSDIDRIEVAIQQRNDFIAATPTVADTISTIAKELGL